MAEATAEQEELTRIDGLCFKAAVEGNAPNVSAYLQRGADMEKCNRRGLLCMVAVRGHTDVIRVLLDAGADINATMVDGKVTPIMTAAKQGKGEVIALLLERGATLPQDAPSQYRLLGFAIHSRNVEVLRFLMARGVQVNSCSATGDTVLMSAARRGFADMVAALIEAGADVNAISHSRMTALRFARINGRNEIVTLLQQAGAQDIPLSLKECLWDWFRTPLLQWINGLLSRMKVPDV